MVKIVVKFKIIEGMEKYLVENNIDNVSELTGKVELW